MMIGFNVPDDYEFKGTEVRDELDAFFQYIWDNASDLVEKYPKSSKIMKILSTWRRAPMFCVTCGKHEGFSQRLTTINGKLYCKVCKEKVK